MALDPIETAKAEITKIYIAAFHRVPDEAGLQNWLNQYTAGVMTYDQIAENFSTQPEYEAKYPADITNEQYITDIYHNLFGRDPDPEGLVNWTNQLNAGVFDKGNLMYAMLETASAQPNNADSIRLENMATFSLNVLAAGASTVEATAELDNITADPATVTVAEEAVIPATTTTPETVLQTAEAAVPTPDTTPPAMASATVNGDGDLVITYGENVGNSVAEASDFVVTVDGATDAVLSASVDGYTVTLTMATKISGASTVNSIVYTATNGTPNSIQDVSSNAAATQTLTTITNYSSYLTAAEAQAAYDFDNGATYLVADTAANLANPAVISAAALGQATDIGVTDTGTVTAADLNTIDNATTATISANSVTGVTGTSTEVTTLLNSIITLNGSEAITLTDAANSTILAADLAAIDAATGAVTITNSVIIDGTADGASTADTIDVSGITFTSGSVTINGNDGNDIITGGAEVDKIKGGTGDDTINAGDGDDIIRGGAGVDIINGDAGDDTFVILGAIGAGDYAASDVTAGTGAAALGLADVIDAGVATSDSGTDGTGETYDGGTGTNTIEIWGNADITGATVSNIQTINTHSTLTIRDTQLQTLATNGAVTLDLLDTNSVITIVGSGTAGGADVIDPEMGLAFLTYFAPAMSATDATNASTFGATIEFNLDLFETGTSYTTYTIKASDVIPVLSQTTNQNDTATYTDATSENSVVYAADLSANGVTATTINSDDGDDIIFVQKMDSSVTIDGGANTAQTDPAIPTGDVLVYDDTNGATDDLDNVTNVEIVSFLDSGASVVAKDSLVATGAMLTVNAVLIDNTTATGLTWDGSAETDGSFLIIGSDYADTITGGALSDRIYADQYDVINGGADTGANDLYDQDFGDIVVFEAPVDSANLTDANLQNIEVINVTDIGADATDTYDFSVQSEAAGFSIHVLAGVDATTGLPITSGVTIKGSTGTDYIVAGAGADTISGEGGDDKFVFTATNSATVVVNPASEDNTNDGVSTGQDSVVDFASGDKILIKGQLADGFNVTSHVLVGTGAGTDGSADTGNTEVDYKTTTYLAALDADATNGFDVGVDVTSDGTAAAFSDNAAAQAATVFDVTLAADTSGTGVTLGAGDDIVVAGATASKVTLGAGNDIFTGGVGADTVTGGAGADTISLGAGNDTAIIAAAGDTGIINYTDVDSSGTVNDGDTVAGFFDVISDFLTYASNGNADADDIDISAVNDLSGGAETDLTLAANTYQILVGNYNYTNGTFIIDGTNGADTLVVFDDGANDVAIVLSGVTDFDDTQDLGQ
ncbi:DUF4214 domain-containing protein [Sulfurimonas sp.]